MVEKLVKILDEIQDRKDLLSEDGKYFDVNLDNPKLKEAEGLACEELITLAGRPNVEGIREMATYGYRVYPGDRDSFGWLTGCIQKGNGPILVFG